ncbi:MAG TPA: hypothetical protein VJ768_00185 [Anaerolineales bacterium]|nr:hypothetical protein [Anaerolineales bacterium]
MNEWERTFRNRFIAGMAGYIAVLPASLLLIGSNRIENLAAVAVVSLLPTLPLIYAMAAVVGNARQQEELKRRIHYEAVLVTALLTGGLTFSYGLLERAEIVPHLPLIIIAPFMIAVWGIAARIISRRY